MAQQTGVSSAAKKTVILLFLIAAVVLLILVLVPKKGPQGPRIVREGDRAPEFRLSGLDGKQVGLSDFRGKVVMVHFWATWCPPCVEEITTIEKLHRDFFGKDFQILAVSVDEDGAGSVSSFMQRNRLGLSVLLNPDRSVAGRYGTFKFPETYIVDRTGFVKSKVIGPHDWNDPVARKAIQDLITAR